MELAERSRPRHHRNLLAGARLLRTAREGVCFMSKVRCTTYTCKSSEEGSEQDFDSLDAQREACAAYILSRASEGWSLVGESYDDGGAGGIRTLDTGLPYTHFPGVRLRPLGHCSALIFALSLRCLSAFFFALPLRCFSSAFFALSLRNVSAICPRYRQAERRGGGRTGGASSGGAWQAQGVPNTTR